MAVRRARHPTMLCNERLSGLILQNKSLLSFTNSLPQQVSWRVCIRHTEANVIKRLYPILFICLFAAPLLFAQDSESNNSQPANIGGTWQISWQARSGTQQATMQIQQDGSKLSGTFQDSNGSSPLTGSIARNSVSFSVQVRGRPMTLAFTGTIDGDKMSGTFQP